MLARFCVHPAGCRAELRQPCAPDHDGKRRKDRRDNQVGELRRLRVSHALRMSELRPLQRRPSDRPSKDEMLAIGDGEEIAGGVECLDKVQAGFRVAGRPITATYGFAATCKIAMPHELRTAMRG